MTDIMINKQELDTQREYMRRVQALNLAGDEIPSAYVHTYGCQQNVSDGEKLKGMLEEMGYSFADSPDNASLILFNTCAVRENAEDRVMGNLGALKRLKKASGARGLPAICVCGCMTQQEKVSERIKRTFPFVDLIFGTHTLYRFPEYLYRVLTEKTRLMEIADIPGTIAEGLPVKRESGFRASVPIMYGCDNFCTYCIVPFVRGRERSRDPDEVISEVQSLISEGYKDILLLGQNVNSYGKGIGVSFPQLLRRIAGLPGDFRVSFMTSHPKDCTKELIDTIAENEKISRHLHLPVQCGSDRILNAMNRHYTVSEYKKLIEYARSKIPDLSLTTDIIVGFPGESYEDFCGTLELMRDVRFDSAYTFIYSKREGTPAARMEDPVPAEEKGRWFRKLLEVQGECGEDSYKKYVGKTLKVLCEGKGRTSPEYYTGKSEQDIIVDFDGDESLIGSFVSVKIEKALSWALVGKNINKTK